MDIIEQIKDFIEQGKELHTYKFEQRKSLQEKHIDWATSITALLTELGNSKVDHFVLTEFDTSEISTKTKFKDFIEYVEDQVNILQNEILPRSLHNIKVQGKLSKFNLYNDPYFIEGYNKEEKLGGGGFGEVFRYYHEQLGLNFAIKFFDPIYYNEEGSLKRFFQEAKMLYTLTHSNIVRIFDVNMREDKPYIRMECINGKDLNEKGSFNPEEAKQIIRQIAEAMQHAHDKKIIHRDLKLSNILLTTDGQIKVIDFGIGAFLDVSLEKELTRTGESVAGGTHTAPELLKTPKLRDRRSDIYSIGSIWYELVIGVAPRGNNLDENLRNKGISQEYIDVVMKCMETDVEKRYSNCSELIETIEKLS
ncbi:serine/threonine-protein kinase [Priestia megaterium]|uniref:serine/threonine-protein kinase n=1 Tax=Priestia megaterium TaxID=1404 RepID=UPI0024695F61|nr:serine/threonine-protein kinase [Priestia megaterium]